jgi:hypothetical protein
MKLLQRATALAALLIGALLVSGCTTTLVLLYAHQQLTDGDPAPCVRLNSVERALRERCGPFVHGSLLAKDVSASGLPQCPLTLATRDPKFWPVLPELLAKGALPEVCLQAPLVALAQRQPCPDFAAASAIELQALRWLAVADARSIHHDAVRMLSCPNARAVALDTVLDGWLVQGQLPAQGLVFSPLGALHPGHLQSHLARELEAQGHQARAAFGSYVGQLPGGFEEALRMSDWKALDWWLARVPQVVNRVPATQGNQLAWIPLARVLTPSFMPDAAQQRATVDYLLARGANPWQPLPHAPGQSVVSLARELKSPLVGLLDPPRGATVVAQPPAAPTLPMATAGAVSTRAALDTTAR